MGVVVCAAGNRIRRSVRCRGCPSDDRRRRRGVPVCRAPRTGDSAGPAKLRRSDDREPVEGSDSSRGTRGCTRRPGSSGPAQTERPRPGGSPGDWRRVRRSSFRRRPPGPPRRPVAWRPARALGPAGSGRPKPGHRRLRSTDCAQPGTPRRRTYRANLRRPSPLVRRSRPAAEPPRRRAPLAGRPCALRDPSSPMRGNRADRIGGRRASSNHPVRLPRACRGRLRPAPPTGRRADTRPPPQLRRRQVQWSGGSAS